MQEAIAVSDWNPAQIESLEEDPDGLQRVKLLFDEGGSKWIDRERVLVSQDGAFVFLRNLPSLPPQGTYVAVLNESPSQAAY